MSSEYLTEVRRVHEFQRSLNTIIRQVGQAPSVPVALGMVVRLEELAANLRRNLAALPE